MRLCKEAVDKLVLSDWANGIILLHDWPSIIENETPKLSLLRPWFSAVLLEMVIKEVLNKNLGFARL